MGVVLIFFSLLIISFSFSLSLGDGPIWKYCLKEPLNPKQPSNQNLESAEEKRKYEGNLFAFFKMFILFIFSLLHSSIIHSVLMVTNAYGDSNK